MEERNEIKNKLYEIIKIELEKCVRNKKVPSKKLLDTIEFFCKISVI